MTSPAPVQPGPASQESSNSTAWSAVWERAEAAAAAKEGDAPAHVTAADPEPTEPAGTTPEAARAEPEKPDAEGTVSVSERIRWRQQKAAERAKLDQSHAQKLADLQQREQVQAQKYSKYEAAEKALESGDYDGYAQAIHGKSWNDLNKEVLRRFTSPEYQRIAKLEAEVKAREEREAQERQTYQRQRAEQQQNQERQQYLQNLGQELATADGALVDHEDPAFVEAVFIKQQAHWDGQETISPAEAAEMVVGEIRSNPVMRRRFAFLQKVFGDQTASQSEMAQAVATRDGAKPVKQGARAPKTVSQKQAVEASSPGGQFDKQAWLRKYTDRLRSSSDE